jgi:hypothetical protein
MAEPAVRRGISLRLFARRRVTLLAKKDEKDGVDTNSQLQADTLPVSLPFRRLFHSGNGRFPRQLLPQVACRRRYCEAS